MSSQKDFIVLDKARELLKTVYGYVDFHPLQAEIISAVLNRKNSLVIMPTGGGKSICYQIPALIFNGLTVVISPLISLMKDQVDQLKENGVPAVLLNSSLTSAEYLQNKQAVISGCIKLLYLAPETLAKQNIWHFLAQVNPCCFAIDEAHCISEWGHDFRPEYRQLNKIKEKFPQAVYLALTATATKRVREDIASHLGDGQQNLMEFIASFNRPNLYLEVIPRQNPLAQTKEFLNKFKDQSGIIYCFSRKQVDDLCEQLFSAGYSVKPYHAGLSREERMENQNLFMNDNIQIIIATIAFGMGINKSNIRFVLHYNLPSNIEAYYQQIGRAGRDGLPASCLLLYSHADTRLIKYFIEQKEDIEQKKIALKHLRELIDYVESNSCRRQLIMTYFGETAPADNCSNCDNCISSREDDRNIRKYDIALFELLKKKRKEIAVAANLPPFTIFHDTALVQMAQTYPQTKFEFLQIAGVGQCKLEKYGTDFIEVIKQYLNSNSRQIFKENKKQSLNSSLLPKHLKSARLCNEGKSIAEIAHIFNIKISTVIDHLYKALGEGYSLKSESVLALSKIPAEKQQEVFSAYRKYSTEKLKPIFDEICGTISYDELRLLRVCYLSKQNSLHENA